MRKRLFCCLRPGAFSDTGCCLHQPAVSVGQAQPEHFDWLQALAPVRMHLHSAKALACAGLSRNPLLNWPHARKVFRGWEGDLLLVAYLRHPARCVPAPALAKLCEARLVCMLPVYHVQLAGDLTRVRLLGRRLSNR